MNMIKVTVAVHDGMKLQVLRILLLFAMAKGNIHQGKLQAVSGYGFN